MQVTKKKMMTKDDSLERDNEGRPNRKDRKKNRNQRRKERIGDDVDAGVGIVGPSMVPEIDDRVSTS